MGCTRALALAASIGMFLAALSGCIVPEDMPALREELGYASVERPDLTVTARASTQTPTVDQPVELTAETDGMAIDEVDLAWDVNGTAYEGASVEVSFATPGMHPVRLDAAGPEGVTASDEIAITVSPNEPPQADLRVEDRDELWADDTVTLTANGSSDPDGDELTYDWRIDGEPVDAGPVLETDLPAGPHEAQVTVSDEYSSATATGSFAVDERSEHEAELTAQQTEARFPVEIADSLDRARFTVTHTTNAGLESVNLTLLDPDGEPVASVQTDPDPGTNQASRELALGSQALSPQAYTLVASLERGTETMATIEGVFTYSPLPSGAG